MSSPELQPARGTVITQDTGESFMEGVSCVLQAEFSGSSRGVFKEQEFLENLNTDFRQSSLVPVCKPHSLSCAPYPNCHPRSSPILSSDMLLPSKVSAL